MENNRKTKPVFIYTSLQFKKKTTLENIKESKFSRSVMSDSLQPHGLQYVSLPCPSLSPRVAQTHVRWVDGAIQLSHPLSSASPPAFNLSQHQGLFQWVGSSHQVPEYWSFSFSISPSNEYSGLISFRIGWFDLAVQGSQRLVRRNVVDYLGTISEIFFLNCKGSD